MWIYGPPSRWLSQLRVSKLLAMPDYSCGLEPEDARGVR
jgi:hypothetical protein